MKLNYGLNILIFLLIPLFCAHVVVACNCDLPDKDKSIEEIVAKEFKSSRRVFIGKVDRIQEESSLGSTFVLSVQETFKGQIDETLEISTAALEGGCGFPFREGEAYLVFASKPDNSKCNMRFTVSRCSRTKAVGEAKGDIEILRRILKEASPKTSDVSILRVTFSISQQNYRDPVAVRLREPVLG